MIRLSLRSPELFGAKHAVATHTSELIPTRASLLARLKHWDDHRSWDEFHQTYRRLIFSVAKRQGLTDSESEDVVQETLLGIAKSLPGFEYDPARSSFKTWLLSVTRRKIVDQVRHRAAELPYLPRWESGSNDGAGIELALAEAGNEDLEAVWEEEWRQHLTETALDRLKASANPKHFQAFYLHVIKGQSGAQVARALDIHLAQDYIIKHRLVPLFRKAVSEIEADLR